MNRNNNYRTANQQDLDFFKEQAIWDENIYPYLSTTKSMTEWVAKNNDWEGIDITNDRRSFILKIYFDRRRDEMNIELFAMNAVSAGRGVYVVMDMIKRYKPRAINSVVHSSNKKSLKLHYKLFGDCWGVEESVAWNSLNGEYEDLHYFRKLLS
jgi:hypothetical protein